MMTKEEKAEAARERRLMRLYNITIADYDKIFEYQKGVCYICETPPAAKRLAVDHDHISGLVRGLLCWKCNYALGKFNDSVVRVVRAAKYVQRPPAVAALGKSVYGRPGRITNKTKRKRKAVKK